MNIIVLVKQVPNTAEVKLDPKTGSLIREGIESIINPDDRHALEAAILLKEAHGGKITVLSMGPPQAIDAISEALGMGADEGILLSDNAPAWASLVPHPHNTPKITPRKMLHWCFIRMTPSIQDQPRPWHLVSSLPNSKGISSQPNPWYG